MLNYIRFINSLEEELKKFKLSCYFCNQFNDENNVNSECKQNTDPHNPKNLLGFNHNNLKIGKHYFVNSNIKSSSLENFKKNSNSAITREKCKVKAKNNSFSSSFLKKTQIPENFINFQNKGLKIYKEGELKNIISFLDEEKIIHLIEKMNEKARNIKSNIYNIFSERYNEFDSVEVNDLSEFLKNNFEMNVGELTNLSEFLCKNFLSFTGDDRRCDKIA